MENLKLEKFYTGYANNFIIKSINLSLKNGEWLGVIGPNGSGKSTLIKGICRILKPFQGVPHGNHQMSWMMPMPMEELQDRQ